MVELLERGVPFDAVFVASDVVALGAIGALREAGLRVPDDVSIVGFDDIPLAGVLRSTPHHRPAAGLRARAGRRTSAPGTHPDHAIASRTLLPTELIVRASTAPPSPR